MKYHDREHLIRMLHVSRVNISMKLLHQMMTESEIINPSTLKVGDVFVFAPYEDMYPFLVVDKDPSQSQITVTGLTRPRNINTTYRYADPHLISLKYRRDKYRINNRFTDEEIVRFLLRNVKRLVDINEFLETPDVIKTYLKRTISLLRTYRYDMPEFEKIEKYLNTT